jgi:hypothetical protein
LEKDKMNAQLDQTITDTIDRIIRRAADPPDPKEALHNAARATTILGKMLEDMADKSAKQASQAARIITNLGLLSYGLVEISVPRSIWSHIASYWLQLLTLIGTAMFVLGLVLRSILRSADTWKTGLVVLVIGWLISGVRDVLRLVMKRRQRAGWALAIQWRLFLIFICLAALAVAYAQDLNHVLATTGGMLIGLREKILADWQSFLKLF